MKLGFYRKADDCKALHAEVFPETTRGTAQGEMCFMHIEVDSAFRKKTRKENICEII